MDVVLRYFNNKSCLVEASYFNSAFLKRPNSHDLHHKLLEFLSTFYLGKLLQVLMDGPNVNWDVLKLHLSYREQNEFSKSINIGSWGLHVLQDALQTGLMETDWGMNKVLHAMGKIFDESPARRDIYIRETGCDQMIFARPYGLRWTHCCTKNSDREYCPDCEVLSLIVKIKCPRNSKLFDTLFKYHADKLISKLHFFKYIAWILRLFLLWFQTSKPVIPFLAGEPDVTLDN